MWEFKQRISIYELLHPAIFYRICTRGAKGDPTPHWENVESLKSLSKIWKVLD